MSGKVFFDTNILVYSLSYSDPRKQTHAKQLLRASVLNNCGVISYQVIQEVLNVGLRPKDSLMTTTEANRYFRTLLLDFELVRWSETLLENAIAIKGRFGFHWYDSLIVSAALQAKCETLYSEDLQHGQSIEGLQVVNPFR